MKQLTKSEIVYMVRNHFIQRKNLQADYMLKNSDVMVKISLEFSQPEVKVDENGVEWVRKVTVRKE